MAAVDSEYVIDIATRMPDGQATAAELDSIGASLIGADDSAAAFESAMKKVSTQLSAATEASKVANEALKAGRAEYSNLEAAAIRTARAEEKAGLAMLEKSAAAKAASDRLNEFGKILASVRESSEEGSEALAAAEKQYNTLALASARANKAVEKAAAGMGATEQNSRDAAAALAKQSNVVERLEQEAKQAAGAQDSLAKSSKNLKTLQDHANKSLSQSVSNIANLKGALGDLGPVGGLGEKVLKPVQAFAELREKMGTTRAAQIALGVGAAGLVVGLGALSVAAFAAAAGFAVLAVKMGDSARSARLASEAARAIDPQLAAIGDQVDMLADKFGLPAKRVQDIGKALIDAKVSAADMPRALKALATAESALGEGGADKFLEQLKTGKKSVAELAGEIDGSLSGIANKRAVELGRTFEKLSRNVSSLFDVPGLDTVLAGLSKMADMFSQAHEVGRGLKVVIGGLFDGFAGQVDDAYFALERFALTGTEWALDLYIAWKKSAIGWTDIVLKAVGWMTIGIVGAIAAIPVALGAALFAVGYVIGDALRGPLKAGAAAVGDFFTGMAETVTGWTKWAVDVGAMIVEGMVKGLTDSAGKMWDAMVGLGESALDAISQALDMHSPSRKMRKKGRDSGEGYALGVDDSEPVIRAAMASAVTPVNGNAPSSGAPSSSSVTNNSLSSGASFNFSGATLVFNGVKDAPAGIEAFAEMLTRTLEGDAITVGAV